ncbi:hypothetical protein [Streptomyces sp. NPDC101393]|uniref:hypothetical protein n=1 Tax=Streptomyces sp. NPDC101393 TaxID=3366141 RepID=UPI00382A93D8
MISEDEVLLGVYDFTAQIIDSLALQRQRSTASSARLLPHPHAQGHSPRDAAQTTDPVTDPVTGPVADPVADGEGRVRGRAEDAGTFGNTVVGP